MRKNVELYLDLRLKGEICEGKSEHSYFSQRPKTALQDVLEVLSTAARRSRIKALVLKLDQPSAGWSTLCSIRRALVEFRRSGKMIFCHLEREGNASYYLANACDRILLAPVADLRLIGLAAEVFFFRELLNRFGFAPHLHAVGDYKSAAEIFTRTGMSPPAREQMEALLDDIYQELCRAIAENRGLNPQEVSDKIDHGPYTAREAVANGLVDGLCYEDEIPQQLEEKIGAGLRAVNSSRLRRGGFFRRLVGWRRPRIAVIDVLGIIAAGETRKGMAGRLIAGAETISKFLDHARKSRRIRAVVLRINSPGGSGLASDAIWHRVAQLSESKPVVASFGDIAASGGYYLAAPATAIVAESISITGSIGVLGGKLVAAELIRQLSVHRESVHRGAHAEFDSAFVPFSAEEAEKLSRQLQEFYREDFVGRVASGRKLAADAVDRAAGGRIWSGMRARDLGLVDLLGGPMEAVCEARRLAGIPDTKKIRLVRYLRKRRLWELLIPNLGVAQVAAGKLPESALELMDAAQVLDGERLLLWTPYDIRIQ